MLRRLLLPLLGLVLLTPPSSATWSIVCVNTRTREVGVASATCLQNFNLRIGVPVVFVGEGSAAAQSFVDTSGQNRRLIYDSYRDTEETPLEILARLAAQDAGHQTRQYGIANFAGDPVTFTGRQAGAWAGGVTGQVGDYLYAIQGNLLTGEGVVLAAEAVFRDEKGDMAQKIMAAMEAARAMGGDGRCSCSGAHPTSCGTPPPSFTKSAHVAVMIVSRPGDTNGGCNANRGCARGDYYLNLNVIGGNLDPDPVFTLHEQHDLWRRNLLGRPDAVLTRVNAPEKLPADGVTERTVVVELRDLADVPLGHGGAQVTVETLDGGPSLATLGPVLDRGDGTYAFTLRAGSTLGRDRLVITASDVDPLDPLDVVTARLYPDLVVESLAAPLYTSADSLSAAAASELDLVVNQPLAPGASYWLVARPAASRRGEAPRLTPGGFALLPIPESPFFPGAPGRLDGNGRAESVLHAPPGALGALAGRRMEVTGWILDGTPLTRTNTVGIEILP